jgi:ankyrin repeat protein
VPESLDTGVLAWTVCAGDVELANLLLRRGLDPGHERHREAPHLAAKRGHAEMVQLLIDHGADPNAVDSRGQTPLERARASARRAVVALLETRARVE